jgi:hypothetical protein
MADLREALAQAQVYIPKAVKAGRKPYTRKSTAALDPRAAMI